MTEDQACILIEKAALAIARRNRDGTDNNDRVCIAIERLLAAAKIINRGYPDKPPRRRRPWPTNVVELRPEQR
jgi:hypothetical protein